jgi:alcohol dehydrogenase class IV
LEAIRLVVEYLPAAIEDGFNIKARTMMAWADTLAGLCIANAGVTLPHGISMAIGGQCPHVSHGQALAAVYPEFMRYTYPSAVGKFARLGGIFNPSLEDESPEVAAERSCEEVDRFLKKIGMWLSLEGLKIAEEEIGIIAERSLWLPDYQNNPRVATREEVEDMLQKSYSR